MQKNAIETATGALVLAGAGMFLSFAYQHTQVSVREGYPVLARFTNATGVELGSDVRIGGIKVGVVSEMALDPKTYQAVLTLELKKEAQLPADSSATIASSGLLGNKFVDITPGGDENFLTPGSAISYTQPSVSLEEMIGKFMFSGGGVGKDGAKNDSKNDPKNDAQADESPKTSSHESVLGE